MMRFLFFIRHICVLGAIFFLHVSVVYLFPAPFAALNVLLVYVTSALLLSRSQRAAWDALALHAGIELFSALPFGAAIISGSAAAVACVWLSHSLIPQRSWYAIAGISFATLLVSRLSSFAFVAVFASRLPARPLVGPYAWEMLETVLVTTLLVWSASRVFRPQQKKLSFS